MRSHFLFQNPKTYTHELKQSSDKLSGEHRPISFPFRDTQALPKYTELDNLPKLPTYKQFTDATASVTSIKFQKQQSVDSVRIEVLFLQWKTPLTLHIQK